MATTTATRSNLWRWLTLASALVTVAPLWTSKYLPFLDLPEHVAAIATLRHWNDPAWAIPATYELALGKSHYLAYHLAGAALAFPLGPDLANRVLVTAAGIGLPYAVRSLLRAFETDERLAILACPLFWSRPLVIGFLPYVASLPVLCWAIALAVRERRDPKVHRSITFALLAIVLFYLHVAGYLLLGLTVAGLWMVPVPTRNVASFARTAMALLPSVACAVLWAVHADRVVESISYGPPRAELGGLFAAWAHDIWRSRTDEFVGIAFWLLVLALGVQRESDEPGGGWAVIARLVPFTCALLMFFAVPYRVDAGAMLNVRLAALFGVLVLPVLRPDPGPRASVALLAGSVLAAVTAIHAAVQIRAARRELGDFDAVLAEIRPGSRVLSLDFDRTSSVTHGSGWVHVAAYHRLRRGGVASLSFSEMTHWPIHYRPEARPPQKEALFWDFKPCLFRNSTDGAYYDFVVSRGRDPFGNDPPGPRWHRRALIDGWSVHEREEAPPRGPGAPDPGPCPP